MTRSLWMDTTPDLALAPLDGDLDVDVCVVGAGIVGLTAALLLAEAGRSVAVLEMQRVGGGVTGHTTAKVTLLHGLVYDEIRSKHGEDGARAYAAANQAGLDLVAQWVQERRIDCDFRRRAAVTYTEDDGDLGLLEDEVAAAKAAGVAARLERTVDLPFPVAGAVVLDDQAEFHPRKYLLGLVDDLQALGGRIFENTRATGAHDGSPCRVVTDQGTVRCADVVVATHFPFLDRALFFARLSPQRSYAIAARIDGPPPDGMFISSSAPTRSIRAHGDHLIVGGEGHKAGQHDSPTQERYGRLETWAHERFGVRSVDYRWSAQDPVTLDGMPYVGRYGPTWRHLWVGTGFRKWGLSNGTAAAIMLADGILGRENAWQATFDANRFKPIAAATSAVKENVNVGGRFVTDRLRAPRAPKCTHMGCHLMFNDAEQTWDCPCHGSRFDTTGRVIQGPAVKDLEPRSAAQPTGS